MGLMMLAAGPGSPISLSAAGREAAAAVEALARLVESKFHED
jgi:phosphocarrier protein